MSNRSKKEEEFYHHMPKKQPCPECGFNSKRILKTRGGANYRCPKHGEFFVKMGRLI